MVKNMFAIKSLESQYFVFFQFLGVNFTKIAGLSVLKAGQTSTIKCHCCLLQCRDLLLGLDSFELPTNADSMEFPGCQVTRWSGVKSVDFSSNQLSEIDDSVVRKPHSNRYQLVFQIFFFQILLESAEILNLSGNNLTGIGESLAQLTCLSELNLSNNRIANIPDCHLRLGQLKRLILARNQVCTLEGCWILLIDLIVYHFFVIFCFRTLQNVFSRILGRSA